MAGVTANELIDPSVLKTLEKLNKELKNTLGILGDLTKQQKATNEELKKGADNNEKLADNKKKVNDNTKKLTEQEKNLIKIQQQEQKVIEQVTGSYNQMNLSLLYSQEIPKERLPKVRVLKKPKRRKQPESINIF